MESDRANLEGQRPRARLLKRQAAAIAIRELRSGKAFRLFSEPDRRSKDQFEEQLQGGESMFTDLWFERVGAHASLEQIGRGRERLPAQRQNRLE